MTRQNSGSVCRACGAKLTNSFIDLGMSPLCQSRVLPDQLLERESFFPLMVYVCDQCFLVQLDEFVAPSDIFNRDYPYFSSCSSSWVAHAKAYVDHVVADHGIGEDSKVVEIASNDGYLLQHFVARNISCYGIEPAGGVADAARARGIETVGEFFGAHTATSLLSARGTGDLILGNNVLAHTPTLRDFIQGIKILLSADGLFTFEFPHLLRLMQKLEFDTIYHEHFSYFSLHAVRQVFAKHGLELFHVKELTTHGGSIRIYGQHAGGARAKTGAIEKLLGKERQAGLLKLDTYTDFQDRVHEIKSSLLEFLIMQKRAGKSVVGYGAPGKGNTLLNYCGIRSDFLEYTVDRAESKQGTYTPGTHIPIYPPDRIFSTKPDYILILPWNLRDEISESMGAVRDWGARFVVPIPELEVF